MADTLRNLVVSLSADITRFSAGMTQAASQTQATMNQINSAVGIAKAGLAGLAGAFSLGAALDFAKETVAAAAALDDLADSTGSSVENLSKLKNQAQVSGASFETLSSLMLKLSAGMAGADDESSNVGRALKALGVDAKDPAEALQQVAVSLSKYQDGIGKAAIARDLFGKGGPAFLSVLKDIAATQDIAATVTTKQAAEAEKLEQAFRRLSVESSTLKNALLSHVVPSLNNVIERFRLAREAGEGYFGALLRAGTNMDTITEQIDRASQALERTRKAAEAAKSNPLRFIPGLTITDADVAAAEAKLRALQNIAFAANKLNASRGNDILPPQLNYTGAKDTAKAARQAVADYRDEIQKLQDEMAKLAGTDGGYTHLIAANEKYQRDLQAGKVINIEQARELMQTAVALDQQEAEVKRVAAAWEAYEKAAKAALDFQKEIDDAIYKANLSIKAQNDALELEHKTLGMTDNARQQFIVGLALEDAAREKNTNGVALLTKQLELLRQQANDNALLKMAEQAQRAFEAATSFASDFFVDLFNNGSKAFKNLWDNFKQLAFRALADIAAKQVVVSIAGAVGLGASGIASASTGGLNLASLFGQGAGAFSAASGAGIGAGLETIKLGITAGLESIGGIGGLIGAATTLLPLAAIAGIAVPLIGKLFGGDGKASRTGTFASGAASLVPDKSRDAVFQGSSAFGAFGIARDFWLGPEAGAAFKPTITAITALDNTIAQMVGGDLTKQITEALANHEITVSLGKEGTDINASGGPGQILKDRYTTVLSAIDAQLGAMVQNFQGTGEELAKFVVGLVALKTSLGDAFKGLQTADVAALAEAVGGIDKLASGLSFVNANFVAEADKAATAQQTLADSFHAIGLEVPPTHQAFRDLLASFDLTTDSGRALYAAVLNLSGAFVEVNGTATQAAEALRAAMAGLEDARANFLGTGQQAAAQQTLTALVNEFAGSRQWAQAVVDASGVSGLVDALATIAQGDFAQYSASDQKLITAILNAGAAAKTSVDTSGATSYSSTVGSRAGTVMDDATAAVEKMLNFFREIAGQTTGNYGEELALQIKLVTGAMKDGAGAMSSAGNVIGAAGQQIATGLKVITDARFENGLFTTNTTTGAGARSQHPGVQVGVTLDGQPVFGRTGAGVDPATGRINIAAALAGGGATSVGAIGSTSLLDKARTQLQASLTLFNQLTTRYSDDVAKNLVKLTETFNQQKEQLQGNAEGLDALQTVFEEQWNAIINGTKTGVDGTLSQLSNLQKGILDYVDGLKISSISPLTPLQKLAEAQRQYDETLQKANAQDPAALADITKVHDAYIRLARDLYASSQTFTDIFNATQAQLTDLGTKSFTDVAPMNAADAALLGVLPIGSKLMSAQDFKDAIGYGGATVSGASPDGPTSKDFKEMASAIVDAIYDAAMLAAKSGDANADKVSGSVEKSKAALVEAITVGRK